MKNYFWCTANFGVVPWFLLAFFLLRPCFFSLLALIVLVCIVLDPISTTPTYGNFSNFKNIYVYLSKHIVKIILISCTFSNFAHSSENAIFLAKGEQKSIYFKDLHRYSIGNKEVLSHKFLKGKSTLRVKGKSIGFSDLVIWDKSSKQIRYQFYVLSKGQYLKTVQWADYLSGLGLNSSIKGNMLLISGNIETLQTYLAFRRSVERIGLPNVHLDVQLKQHVKNQIFARIYKDFVKAGDSNINCRSIGTSLKCHHSIESKSLIKYYEKEFFVSFVKIQRKLYEKNLRVSLNILRIEYQNKSIKKLGTQRLYAKVQSILDNGFETIIGDNELHFEDLKASIHTVANPQAMITTGETLKLELGNEQPFVSGTTNTINTNWKFAGLRINIKIDRIGNRYYLKYKTQLSNNSQNNINGSKEASGFFIELDNPVQLFKIGKKEKTKQETGIPILKSIPLLGGLFRSKENHDIFQEIIGHIKVEELI